MSYLERLDNTEENSSVTVPRTGFIIGRDDDCNLTIVSSLVSRHHATISYIDDCWYLEDQGSTNGTLVNSNMVTRCKLSSGDVIAIGGFQFRFHADTENDNVMEVVEGGELVNLMDGKTTGS